VKTKPAIWILVAVMLAASANCFAQEGHGTSLNFLKDTISLRFTNGDFVDFKTGLSEEAIRLFYERAQQTRFVAMAKDLMAYKTQNGLNDWFYYQLIRKTAQAISPKADNYHRYTLYKWFFLRASGYDAILTIYHDKILLYVRSDENVYNIPYRFSNGKNYICLNYHDYGFIDFEKEKFVQVLGDLPGEMGSFSYKVTQVPEFNDKDYSEKKIEFTYYKNQYQFTIKLNPEVKNIFKNYPVVDYEEQFNMPLSKKTYESLLSSLREPIAKMKQKEGIDFLLHFTRYAFLFKADSEVFGSEKRMSPEQTLLYEYSDCEDRAALFFFLVKEIYNLPMIILSYPQHVTVAVAFDKPNGKTIEYNGRKYSVCEPSPQRIDLRIGQMLPELVGKTYQVAYAYNPK
jgi:hypothetical protein